jgi:arylsulfatase
MMKKKRLHILFAIFLFALSCSVKKEAPVKNRPNFLIIMADDLGYTDLGCYGGEIRTPNLDALARNGILNTDFYTSPTCSPTRAMLLSGVDAHRSGFGTMEGDWAENQRGLRGYEGYLNFDIVPFPQLLQAEGYHTSIAGKWHQASPPVRKDLWPVNRGFSKSFCLAQGGAGHFSDKQKLLPMIKSTLYFSDSSLVDTLPHDFYSSKNYVDKSIEFIGQSLAEQKPFFHFLAFTAPHWPLQVCTKANTTQVMKR